MDASLCTVVILYQTKPYQEDNYHQQLFKSNFEEVYIQYDLIDAITTIRQQCFNLKSTLLLVDLDTIDYDYIIKFLEIIVRELNLLLPNHNIPLVVCSEMDSTDLMLSCIHAGAIDYLLKPLYSNVIKTLCLKLHQCKFVKDIKGSASSTPNIKFQPLSDRMNEMNLKDSYLSKMLMDIFLPKVIHHQEKILHWSKKRSSELNLQISSWNFSPFDFNQSELIHCAYLIFEKVLSLPGLRHIALKKDQLEEFITDLANVYRSENPYHNFTHAVDVLQCLYFTLCQLGVMSFHTNASKSSKSHNPQDLLQPKHIFALFIAAIGHDAAHPGVNNVFLVNSSNPLAVLYNDRSVLENLHSTTLFQLLSKHGIIQLVGAPNSDDYKEFRKVIVSSILSTDMSLHPEYLARIKEQQASTIPPENVIILCCALIKCADISNVARPFRCAAQWARLLTEEFVCQGDLERDLGLPVLPMCDRNKVVLEDSQISFIRCIALDLFQSVQEIFREISFAVDQIQANLKQWEMRKDRNLLQHDSGVLMEDENNVRDTEMRIVVETGSKRKSSITSLEYYSLNSKNDSSNKRTTVENKKILSHHHLTTSSSSLLNYHQAKLEDNHIVTEEILQQTIPSLDYYDISDQPRRVENHVHCHCCIQ
ncbi:MAG: hypothetical protein EXX96DRAFT_509592 [Benjaminiella poitrasii]|nr:MAG: hypothetical protein EXX96DRAFT_509592 [Benjaminiella poitrasii]